MKDQIILDWYFKGLPLRCNDISLWHRLNSLILQILLLKFFNFLKFFEETFLFVRIKTLPWVVRKYRPDRFSRFHVVLTHKKATTMQQPKHIIRFKVNLFAGYY